MKRLIHWTLVLCMALPLLLSACVRGPKVEECLAGIWQINDPDAFGRATLPAGSFPPGALNFLRGNEGVAYQFDENGVISVLTVDWHSAYDFDVGGEKSLMELYMDGYVYGKYQVVDNKRVMVTYVSASQQAIEFQAITEGQVLMETEAAVEFLPLFVHPSNIADIACTQDTLSLTILNRSDLEAPITFRRTQ